MQIEAMLIDNKVNRYPDSGFNIRTVWDFINEFSGTKSGQIGHLDIVTGYFTLRALSKLYHEVPEEDHFRIVSSEMVMQEDDNHLYGLTYDEVLIVDPETPITREEYNNNVTY